MHENCLVESTPQALILAADSESGTQARQILLHAGWCVETKQSPEQNLLSQNPATGLLIVIIEKTGCETALALLTQWQAKIARGLTAVIVFSAQPASADALHCLQQGAADYCGWPLLPSEMVEIAAQARRQYLCAAPPTEISRVPALNSNNKTIIGGSRPMLELSRQLVKVALAPELPVLLNGETGTGKEIVAWQIHQLSKRSGAFRAINCAAMVETLLESELFGHEKGAFTGAYATKKGLWEEAANGTIFLDEITEASPTMQAKLLRVLQESTIRRVGSNHEIQVTARIIAASNRNLTVAVKDGLFREDLYYRLGQVLSIPTLRERSADIPLLVEYFCQRAGKGTIFTDEALQLLSHYHWPGNVRELESIIHKLIAYGGTCIYSADVERYLPHPELRERPLTSNFLFGLMQANSPGNWPTAQELRECYVIEAWHRWGRESQVARILGMDYRTVNLILRKAKLIPDNDEEPLEEPPLLTK